MGAVCGRSTSRSEKGGERVLGEDEQDNAHLNGEAVWCLFFLSQAKKESTLYFELQFPPTFFPLCFFIFSKVCRGD